MGKEDVTSVHKKLKLFICKNPLHKGNICAIIALAYGEVLK